MSNPTLAPLNGPNFNHDNHRVTAAAAGSIAKRLSLANKTAIITGGGAGIGYGVAVAYAEMGCNIALWYNTNDAAIQKAEALAKEFGIQCKAYKVDIRNFDSVDEAVTCSVRDLNGRLDIFVANAGVPWTKGVMVDGPLDHYKDVVDTNLDGVYYCAKAAAGHWRRQKQSNNDIHGAPLSNFKMGSFIATASMSAWIANIPQLQASYNAAKAGVIHLCKSLSVEWAQFARANTVSPGYIYTGITGFIPPEYKEWWQDKVPLGRQGEVHELQGAFLYLGSDLSTYTTGTDLLVDGGYCAV